MTNIVNALNKSMGHSEQVVAAFNNNADKNVQDVTAGLIAHFSIDYHSNRAIIDKLERIRKDHDVNHDASAAPQLLKAAQLARIEGHHDTAQWLQSIRSSNLMAEVEIRKKHIVEYGHSATYSDDYAVRQREGAEARQMQAGLEFVKPLLQGIGFECKPATTDTQAKSTFVAYRDMLTKHFPAIHQEHKTFIEEGMLRAGQRNGYKSGIECERFYEAAKKALLSVGHKNLSQIKRELMIVKNELHEFVKNIETTPGHSRAFQQQFMQESYQKCLKLLTVAEHDYQKSLPNHERKRTTQESALSM
ncbi:MAG: hypothetical protein RSG77_14910 [Hafnia sp.]